MKSLLIIHPDVVQLHGSDPSYLTITSMSQQTVLFRLEAMHRCRRHHLSAPARLEPRASVTFEIALETQPDSTNEFYAHLVVVWTYLPDSAPKSSWADILTRQFHYQQNVHLFRRGTTVGETKKLHGAEFYAKLFSDRESDEDRSEDDESDPDYSAGDEGDEDSSESDETDEDGSESDESDEDSSEDDENDCENPKAGAGGNLGGVICEDCGGNGEPENSGNSAVRCEVYLGHKDKKVHEGNTCANDFDGVNYKGREASRKWQPLPPETRQPPTLKIREVFRSRYTPNNLCPDSISIQWCLVGVAVLVILVYQSFNYVNDWYF